MVLTLLRHLTNNRGQSLVEFALILPVFVLLLGGIIDFGRVYNEMLTMTAAAREGARAATVGNSDSVAKSSALNYLSPSDQATASVVITPTAPRTSGTSVTVTVSNQVTIMTPVISAFFPKNPITVTGTSVMRVE